MRRLITASKIAACCIFSEAVEIGGLSNPEGQILCSRENKEERQKKKTKRRQIEGHHFCAISGFEPGLGITCHCMCFSDREVH